MEFLLFLGTGSGSCTCCSAAEVCGNELRYKLWALIFLFVSVVLIQYQCASRGRVKKVMFVGFFLG